MPKPTLPELSPFTHTVSEEENTSAYSSLPVQTTTVNTAPLAGNDSFMAMSGAALNMNLGDLLSNDSDIDGDSLSIVSYEMLGEATGALVQIGDNLYYHSDQEYEGVQTVQYTLSDGYGGTATGLIEITVESSMHHHGDIIKAPEHTALMSLVNPSEATHIAVQNGDWSNAATWQNVTTGEMEIPGAESRVFIPVGVRVSYDVDSTVPLFAVRVDGTLSFATDVNTTMVVDTLVTTSTSQLHIGTETNPIQNGITAEIIIRSDGESVNLRDWDSGQLSKGIITHGQVRIYGQDKADFLTLTQDALAGQDHLDLTSAPQGWTVGDMIVLGGTSYDENGSDADNTRFHDEVLEITQIDGNTVHFINRTNDAVNGQTTLAFDHTRPDGTTFDASEFNLYVSNLSRNITIRSEDGPDTAIDQRGHVMFMHNPDVEVHDAAFVDLGRTDKNELLNGVGEQPDGSTGTGENVRGRYALHFHRTGAEDIEGTPAEADGNVIWGSPGWGLVHHQSHLVAENNVVFDVVGAGIVSEAGDEIGVWRNNIVIKTTGDNNPLLDLNGGTDRAALGDFGFNGEAYWMQGGIQIEFHDNIAISSMTGINMLPGTDGISREADSIAVKNLNIRLDDGTIIETEIYQTLKAAGYADDDRVDVSNLPVKSFEGFEAYNVDLGFVTWNMMRNDDGQIDFSDPGGNQAHDVWSLFQDVSLWNVFGTGIMMEYTTQAHFQDFLIVGDPSNPVTFEPNVDGDGRGTGIDMNKTSQKLIFDTIRLEGFERGMHIPEDGGFINSEIIAYEDSVPLSASRLINSEFANNTYNFTQIQAYNHGTHMLPSYFEIENTIFHAQPGNTNIAPVVAFESSMVGDQGVAFLDASLSYDPDAPDALRLSQGAISSFGWDFNNDGIIDDYGRFAVHDFNGSGNYSVGLTIWDAQGLSSTEYHTITVDVSEGYDNLFKNADFNGSTTEAMDGYGLHSLYGNDGWIIGDSFSVSADPSDSSNTVMALDGVTSWTSGFGQVLWDNGQRQGEQELHFDMNFSDGLNTSSDTVTVQIYGINGEYHMPVNGTGPTSADAMTAPAITEILNVDISQDTAGWQHFVYNTNFGDGYDYIVLNVSTSLNMSGNLDTLMFDNFYLGDGQRPESVDDHVRMSGADSTAIYVLENDTDINGGVLTIDQVSAASHGQTVLNQNGTIQYTPDEGFSGEDSFTYILRDQNGNTDLGKVTVKVDPVNSDKLMIHYNFDQDIGWRFAEDMGTDSHDTDGVLFGDSERIEAGVSGQAIHINNTNTGGVYNIDDPASFIFLDNDDLGQGSGLGEVYGPTANTYDQKSFSLWFKLDESKQTPQVIADFGTDGNGLSAYVDGTQLVIGGESIGWASWKTSDVSVGQWHHIALSLNGTDSEVNGQSAHTLNVWLDGQLITETAEETGTVGSITGSGSFNDDALGASRFGMAYHGDGLVILDRQNGMTGALDEFRLYDRVLSAGDATGLFFSITPPDTNNGDNIFNTGNGNDMISSGNGNDVISYVGGLDTYDDTSGTDTVELPADVALSGLSFIREADHPNDLKIHVTDTGGAYMGHIILKNQFVTGYAFETLSLSSGQTIDLTNLNIITIGSDNADSVAGISTNSNLNDVFFAFGGDDILDGGDGNDYLDGSSGNDTLYGNNGADALLGGFGVDNLYGMDGNDILYGGDQNDLLYGQNGIDWIEGGSGNDQLYGGADVDLLFAQDGDDILNGGAGADYLDGGAGSDTFVFTADSAFAAIDSIVGFNQAEGDALDISDLLTGYDPSSDFIMDFVQITEYGSSSALAVDSNGGGNAFVFVALLYNASGLTDVHALEQNGTLITV